MGDRFTIHNSLICAYCGFIQEEVYFAESSEVTTHKCEKCGKENKIIQEFYLAKRGKREE